MFGKQRAPEQIDSSEFRVHDRHVVQGLKVYVDRELVEILDYSDGGMRIRTNRKHRRTAVIEIFRNDRAIRTVVGVVAWERGDQVGYSFRPKLKIAEIGENQPARVDTLDVNRNTTGGVSGSALRSRLKL